MPRPGKIERPDPFAYAKLEANADIFLEFIERQEGQAKKLIDAFLSQ